MSIFCCLRVLQLFYCLAFSLYVFIMCLIAPMLCRHVRVTCIQLTAYLFKTWFMPKLSVHTSC